MPYIVCPNCHKHLYTAADTSVVICPYCNREIDEIDKGKKQENDTKEQA